MINNFEIIEIKKDIHFLLSLLVSSNHSIYEIRNFYGELLYRLQESVDKLEKDYRMEKSNITIAVDFDGTLCSHEFPNIGEPDIELINLLKEFKCFGGKLILTTLREDCYREDNDKIELWPMLTEAIEWCANYGLFFDKINERISYNPLDGSLVGWTGARRKLDFDYIIDDRAVGYKREDMLKHLRKIINRTEAIYKGEEQCSNI